MLEEALSSDVLISTELKSDNFDTNNADSNHHYDHRYKINNDNII